MKHYRRIIWKRIHIWIKNFHTHVGYQTLVQEFRVVNAEFSDLRCLMNRLNNSNESWTGLPNNHLPPNLEKNCIVQKKNLLFRNNIVLNFHNAPFNNWNLELWCPLGKSRALHYHLCWGSGEFDHYLGRVENLNWKCHVWHLWKIKVWQHGLIYRCDLCHSEI